MNTSHIRKSYSPLKNTSTKTATTDYSYYRPVSSSTYTNNKSTSPTKTLTKKSGKVSNETKYLA